MVLDQQHSREGFRVTGFSLSNCSPEFRDELQILFVNDNDTAIGQITLTERQFFF